jgi:hypothetical protein
MKKMSKAMYGKTMMKTGGMTNANAKVVASKIAKGTVGGKSKAPKTAVPKAKMGMSVKGKKSC